MTSSGPRISRYFPPSLQTGSGSVFVKDPKDNKSGIVDSCDVVRAPHPDLQGDGMVALMRLMRSSVLCPAKSNFTGLICAHPCSSHLP